MNLLCKEAGTHTSASVSVFPFEHRRQFFLQAVASVHRSHDSGKHRRKLDHFTNAIRSELTRIGLPPNQREEVVYSFTRSVEAAIQRQCVIETLFPEQTAKA